MLLWWSDPRFVPLSAPNNVRVLYVCGSGESIACLIQPVIEGPPSKSPVPSTASVSYYIGRYIDFVLPENEKKGKRNMAKYACQTYVPVVQADDPHEQWRAEGAFQVRLRFFLDFNSLPSSAVSFVNTGHPCRQIGGVVGCLMPTRKRLRV